MLNSLVNISSFIYLIYLCQQVFYYTGCVDGYPQPNTFNSLKDFKSIKPLDLSDAGLLSIESNFLQVFTGWGAIWYSLKSISFYFSHFAVELKRLPS